MSQFMMQYLDGFQEKKNGFELHSDQIMFKVLLKSRLMLCSKNRVND